MVALNRLYTLKTLSGDPASVSGWPISGSILQAMDEAAVLFKAIDSNGDGVLSAQELGTRLSDHGLSHEEITRLFLALDTDGDGEVASAQRTNPGSPYDMM